MKYLYAILACTHFLAVVVKGSGHNISRRNDTTTYGGRIFHGGKAASAEFPYVVRLEIGTEVCGGSVVSNFHILTAAHCIHEKNCKKIGISPSYWKVRDQPTFHAEECMSHEKYPAVNRYQYDIGLIRTKENLIIDGRFAQAQLPPPHSTVPDDTPAVIVGWGLEEDNFSADFLKRGDMFVLKWSDCKEAYARCRNCPSHTIPKETICVVGAGDKPDGACSGDSGGPVIIGGVVRGIIICVITNAAGKCVVGRPTLATTVAEFISWIHTHM